MFADGINFSCQPLHLGLFRSDYLLHQPTPDEPISFKQVEFNTISSSFGALSQKVAGMHRWVRIADVLGVLTPFIQVPHRVDWLLWHITPSVVE